MNKLYYLVYKLKNDKKLWIVGVDIKKEKFLSNKNNFKSNEECYMIYEK